MFAINFVDETKIRGEEIIQSWVIMSVNEEIIILWVYCTYSICMITSDLYGGYVIIGVCPSVCVCLLENSVTQKLNDGFSSNCHPLSIYALVRAD